MATVLWLLGGACSGNTMSFLNAEDMLKGKASERRKHQAQGF
jgi:Ni,Fe-hydrogenase I small subunit